MPLTPIYLDHAATTPIAPAVLDAMMPYLTSEFGNPSSLYGLGQRARKALDLSREQVALLLKAEPKDIIFTSGGTEANNTFILGVAEVCPLERRHIISTRIEHDSVLRPIEHLRSDGFEVTYLEVNSDGLINPDDLRKALRPSTAFVSIHYANNEIGTIQPVHACSEIIKEFRNNKAVYPYFHTDACQAGAYLSLNVEELGVDAMTLNAGKIYGPKGAGCLYIRGGGKGDIHLMPRIFGGGQEYRLRSGTENVAGIVGFSKALHLAQQNREKEAARLLVLRDMLLGGILKMIPDTKLNGSRIARLPNNVNISFKGLHGEPILVRLDMLGIAASSGSACSSGSLEPSHVIRALNIDSETQGELWSRSATRFTLGHQTTEEEITYVLRELPVIIRELRDISPF